MRPYNRCDPILIWSRGKKGPRRIVGFGGWISLSPRHTTTTTRSNNNLAWVIHRCFGLLLVGCAALLFQPWSFGLLWSLVRAWRRPCRRGCFFHDAVPAGCVCRGPLGNITISTITITTTTTTITTITKITTTTTTTCRSRRNESRRIPPTTRTRRRAARRTTRTTTGRNAIGTVPCVSWLLRNTPRTTPPLILRITATTALARP